MVIEKTGRPSSPVLHSVSWKWLVLKSCLFPENICVGCEKTCSTGYLFNSRMVLYSGGGKFRMAAAAFGPGGGEICCPLLTVDAELATMGRQREGGGKEGLLQIRGGRV